MFSAIYNWFFPIKNAPDNGLDDEIQYERAQMLPFAWKYKKACESSKLIVTVEEHSTIGGLGSAVAEYKATLKNTPSQFFIGLPDNHGKAGEYKDLLEKHGLTAIQIAKGIVNQYERV